MIRFAFIKILKKRHWGRVMLTRCDMVTHVCTKLSGNWSDIYKCLTEMHSQVGNKNALLACLDARASAGSVMTTHEFRYGLCYHIHI